MKIPHFFILRSRLGLKYPPLGSTQLNEGVENGGEIILSNDWLLQFPNHVLTSFDFPLPTELSAQNYVQQVGEEYRKVSDEINEALKNNEIQVVLGGDHSVGFPSLRSVMKRVGAKDVGVLMVDSHADLHKTSTSPSGNIHGMWLRMLCNDFDISGITAVVGQTLEPRQLCFVGNLQVEDEEMQFLTHHHIPVYSSADLTKTTTLQSIESFLHQYTHIHLCFDIDVFQESLISATGTPNPEGMSKQEIFPILDLVRKGENLSIDLVEVNPKKPGSTETIAVAQEVLEKLLKD